MRKLFYFSEFEKKIEKIFESVISADELDRLDSYFNHMNDDKKFYDNIQKEIEILKTDFKKLDYNEIDISVKKDVKEKIIKVRSYSGYIDSKIHLIKKLCIEYPDGEFKEETLGNIFTDIDELYININLIVINDNFNRVHIGGLPEEFKKLGIGYKLYKATMKKLGYISSEEEGTVIPAFSAKSIWKKFTQDPDCYSIIQEKKILCFHYTCNPTIIKKILISFFKNYIGKNYKIDEHLITKYPDIFTDELSKFI